MREKGVRLAAWTYRKRGTLRGWALKAVGVYFGYRILHHEVYETDTAEPILVAFGMWLCGIPLASFFDGLKKLGASAQERLEPATANPAADVEGVKPELKSGENGA